MYGGIIGGPPLENYYNVWRYGLKKRHEQYQIRVGCIIVRHFEVVSYSSLRAGLHNSELFVEVHCIVKTVTILYSYVLLFFT